LLHKLRESQFKCIILKKGDDEMVAQKLKELRTEHKLTQNDVAALLNISREAYCMYENERRQLNYEALCIIARYYKVSLDYLFGRTGIRDLPAELTEDEEELLSQYRELDVRGQENILDMARMEYKRQTREKKFTGSAV
jgi:transcriptional regulator with XRE-family HTH domain